MLQAYWEEEIFGPLFSTVDLRSCSKNRRAWGLDQLQSLFVFDDTIDVSGIDLQRLFDHFYSKKKCVVYTVGCREHEFCGLYLTQKTEPVCTSEASFPERSGSLSQFEANFKVLCNIFKGTHVETMLMDLNKLKKVKFSRGYVILKKKGFGTAYHIDSHVKPHVTLYLQLTGKAWIDEIPRSFKRVHDALSVLSCQDEAEIQERFKNVAIGTFLNPGESVLITPASMHQVLTVEDSYVLGIELEVLGLKGSNVNPLSTADLERKESREKERERAIKAAAQFQLSRGKERDGLKRHNAAIFNPVGEYYQGKVRLLEADTLIDKVPQSEVEKLREENARLKKEVEELKNDLKLKDDIIKALVTKKNK